MARPTVKFRNPETKSFDDKLKAASQNGVTPTDPSEAKSPEVIKNHVITHIPALEVEKNYQLKTVGIRVDVKKDLNRDIDLLCIELEKNKKELIETALVEFVRREKKKLEK